MQLQRNSFVGGTGKISRKSLRSISPTNVPGKTRAAKAMLSRDGSVGDASRNGSTRSQVTARPARPQALVADLSHVIHELRDLLESYAPTWYTLEHHDMVEAAVGRLNNLQPS